MHAPSALPRARRRSSTRTRSPTYAILPLACEPTNLLSPFWDRRRRCRVRCRLSGCPLTHPSRHQRTPPAPVSRWRSSGCHRSTRRPGPPVAGETKERRALHGWRRPGRGGQTHPPKAASRKHPLLQFIHNARWQSMRAVRCRHHAARFFSFHSALFVPLSGTPSRFYGMLSNISCIDSPNPIVCASGNIGVTFMVFRCRLPATCLLM